MSDESPYFTSTTKWFTQDGFKALFGRMASMLRRLEWSGLSGGQCFICGGSGRYIPAFGSLPAIEVGHKDPCDLATLLREIGP